MPKSPRGAKASTKAPQAESASPARHAQASESIEAVILTTEELDRLVREHVGTIPNVLMTSSLATHILKHYNTGNRKLRVMHANQFADVLEHGRWLNTGEPVIFAKEGILNDGQHRLEGVARSGIAATMDLRFGVPRQAFALTDTGAKRQAADVLSIIGSTSPFSSAAAIRLLLAYQQGLPGAYLNSSRVGNDEIMAGYERWPEVERAVDFNYRILKRQGFINAASNAFTAMAMRQAGQEAVAPFLALVESGLTPSKHDAPRMLREQMLADRTMVRNARASAVTRLALFIKAWNYWRIGERPRVLRWRADEQYPVMEVTL